jgi:hypothetical protein
VVKAHNLVLGKLRTTDYGLRTSCYFFIGDLNLPFLMASTSFLA